MTFTGRPGSGARFDPRSARANRRHPRHRRSAPAGVPVSSGGHVVGDARHRRSARAHQRPGARRLGRIFHRHPCGRCWRRDHADRNAAQQRSRHHFGGRFSRQACGDGRKAERGCRILGRSGPGNTAELRPMWEAGVFGFKCFLVPSGVDEFPPVTEKDLRAAMPVLAELGAPCWCTPNCPDRSRSPSGPPRQRPQQRNIPRGWRHALRGGGPKRLP